MTLYADRYELGERLSEGSFGVVFKARDVRLDRPVVVKVLKKKAGEDTWGEKQVKREAEALARIDHRGVVGVLDVGESPDRSLFLVMQFVDGLTLRDEMKRYPEGLHLERAASILKELCDAIGAAHEQGVFHRDLKPENVMLQRVGAYEEQVKVIDFGVARVTKSDVIASSVMTDVIGTLAYIAPEQLQGVKKGFEGFDVYALGVIAYELVTGRKLHGGLSHAELLQAHRQPPSPMPRALRRDLPRTAEEAILKALAYDPAARFRRARDLGAVLARALGEEDVPSFQPEPHVPAPVPVEVEVAYVLAVGLPGFAGLPLDGQAQAQVQLQRAVRQAPSVERALAAGRAVRVTGPGRQTVTFFGDAMAPARCAQELRNGPLAITQVVHTGPVYRTELEGEQRVVGTAIERAERLLGEARPGEVIVTRNAFEVLGQLGEWKPLLEAAGERGGDAERGEVWLLAPPPRAAVEPPTVLVPPPPPPSVPPAASTGITPGPPVVAVDAAPPPRRPSRTLGGSVTIDGAREDDLESAGASLWGQVMRSRRRPVFYRMVPLADAALRLRHETAAAVQRPRRQGLAAIVGAVQDPEANAYVMRYEAPAGLTLDEVLAEGSSAAARVEAVALVIEALPRLWNAAGGRLLLSPADVVIDEAGAVCLLPLPTSELPPVDAIVEAGPAPGLALAPELLRGGTPSEASDVYALGVALLRCFFDPARASDVDEALWRAAGGAAWQPARLAARVPQWMLRLEAAQAVLAVATRMTARDPAARPIAELPRLATELQEHAGGLERAPALRRLLEAGRLNEAHALFQDLQGDAPPYDVLLMGADIALRVHRPLEALEAAERAIVTRADRPEAYETTLRAVDALVQAGQAARVAARVDAPLWRAWERLGPARQARHEMTVARFLLQKGDAQAAAQFIHPRMFDGAAWVWWKLALNLAFVEALLGQSRLEEAHAHLAQLRKMIQRGRENRSLSEEEIHRHGPLLAELEVAIHQRRRSPS